MKHTAHASWIDSDLSNLIATIQSGQRPYGGVTEDGGDIPSLGGENIRQRGGIEVSAVKKVPFAFFRSMTKGVLANQDVLINKDGANTGKVGIYEGQFPVASINEHLFLLRGQPDKIRQRFLYGVLSSEHGQRIIRAKISGSAQPGLKSDFVRNFALRVPESTAEQSRIAEVLDTMDKAIAKSEAVIAKLKQVRAGLLHDVLTCGLDEQGQLRNPIAHPDHFKDSPLGRIPREWEVATLVSRITLPEGQVDPRVPPYADWLLVAPDHIESGTGRLLATQTAAEQDAISGKYLFEAGDVVYSKIRPYLRKAILAGFQGLCSADMYPLRPKAGINSRFLLAVILGEPFSRFASAVSMRSGFPKINREELAQFVTAWPKTFEQDRIAEVLKASDSEQLAVERELAKLQQLKSGLTNDLLTGRVRVPEGIADGGGYT